MFHSSRPAAGIGGTTPPRGGGADLLGTIGIAFCHNGALSGGRLIAPIIALDLGMGPALVGAMAAVFTAVPIVATVRFGRWVDRAGTLLPGWITTAMLVIATGAMIALPGMPALLFAAVLLGTASVFNHVAVTRAVGGEGDAPRRRRNFGFLAAGYSLCQFAGPMMAGVAYDAAGGRGAFAALGLMAALSLGIMLSGRHMLSSTMVAPPRPPDAAAPRMIDLFGVPGMTRGLFVYGMSTAVVVFFALAGPLHGAEVGLSASQIGALYGIMSLGGLTSRLVVAPLTRRMAELTLLAIAIGVGAGFCVLFPLFTGWAPLAAVSFCIGLSLGLGQPTAMSLVYGLAPPARVNEVVGLSMALGNALQLAQPLVLGMVAAVWGVGPMIWIYAVLLAMTGVIAAQGRTGRPRDRD